MPIGSIKLNTKTLDNLSKINFESYLDGVGKPLDGLAEKIGGLDKYASKLFGNIEKFSQAAIQALSKESKFKNFLDKMEKTMNSIGKVVGGFIGGVKNFVGNLIKAGINTLKKITNAVLNALQIGKLATALKNCFNTILGFLKKPFEFLSNLVKKALRFVKGFLGALGSSLNLKSIFKKDLLKGLIPESLSSALSKILSKSIILATLTGIKYRDDNDLYNTSKTFINSNGYNSVMNAFRTIFNKSLYYTDEEKKNNYSQMYKRVYDRLFNEYYNEDDEDILLSNGYNKIKFKSLARSYDFGDEGRGWMNYDIKSLSEIPIEDLRLIYSNESLRKRFPFKPIVSYTDFNSYEPFNNNDINNFEKILAMADFNRDQYYLKNEKFKKTSGSAVSKFKGFNKTYKLEEKKEKEIINIKKERVTGF